MPPAFREERDYLLTRQYRVWYGTDREPAGEESLEPYFTREVSEQLHLGSCLVHVPKTHRFGELGSSWLRQRFQTWVLRQEADTLRILSVESCDEADFVNSIGAELAHWKRRTALIFVHGYNVSFRDAALRAAQIGFDLRVDGIMAFFSWPSKGDLLPYSADESRVELAEKHFVSFVELLTKAHGLEEINILAHSMGNRLVLRTVESLLRLKQAGQLKVPIGQIVLAAADVTAALFKQVAQSYADLATHRVTNYTYRADKALLASRKLHDQPRVGLEPPIFTQQPIETISVSQLDLDLLGHGYIATAEPLLYDLGQLIHDNKPAGARTRVQPALPQPSTYWLLGP